ncbi:MAG: dihydrofolate reductase [Rhodospirillales bacterium]|nr:dihydrofolate reductase [Rhodospirillales bacterium]
MRVSLIVAMTENRIIGREGGMPWHIPEDLKYFKRVTMGAPIIMGRKTFDSIGRALPGRANIVITRDPDYAPAGIDVVHSLEAAITKASAQAAAAGKDEIFVIGGAQIYELALPRADRLYMTEIHQTLAGDAAFPAINGADWTESGRERHAPEQPGGPAFSFVVLDRQR